MSNKYVLTDGERYLYLNHAGVYVPGSGEAMADVFSSRKEAEKALNTLNKTLKKMFKIEKTETDEAQLEKVEGMDPVTNQDVSMTVGSMTDSDACKKWLEKAKASHDLYEDAEARSSALKNELEKVEKELLDLLHYAEFAELSAAQGYKLYQLLHDARVRRRAIKDEMNILKIIISNKDNSFKDLLSSVNVANGRTYKPRLLDELFKLDA